MINWAYAHLFINHFPIVLGVVGAVAAVLALAMQRRTVWLFAVACLTIAGIFAQPVVMTGDVAADVMKDAWFISRDALREHEAAGRWARWALLLSGAASAFAWLYLIRAPRTTAQQRAGRTGEFPGWLQMLVVVSALVSVAVTGRAGWLGGRLAHASPALSQPPGAAAADTIPTLPPVAAPVPSAASSDSARRADSARAADSVRAARARPQPGRRRSRRSTVPDTGITVPPPDAPATR